jgi:hemerythrin-like metal-binding protein
MFIRWSDKHALGNVLIDTQHRMLMMLCRKLDIAIKTQQSEQTLQRIMLEVKKFAEFHFVSEQNLMHEIGFSEVDAHSRLHTALLIDLQVELSKIRHRAEFPEDLLYSLKEWLVSHIEQEDSKIVAYVRDSASRPIGENLYNEYLFTNAAPPQEQVPDAE